MKNNSIIFIIGVSGVGKSTIGKLLSKELNIPYFDGDDYHPQDNILKMSNGQPLTDADRQPWLFALNNLAKKQLTTNSCIIACSALKKTYRDTLQKDIKHKIEWVHLHGNFDQVLNRLKSRSNHFMPSELLKSQFDTLEMPEKALTVDINLNPKEIVQLIVENIFNKSEFGLFGLGVMGKSLSRNLARNGFNISIYNRHVAGLEENVAIDFKKGYEELSTAQAFDDIADFVHSLQAPRKILLMVNAGHTIDQVIEDLLPHLSKGDIIIDGGNSNYEKTNERANYLKSKNINFIGIGVSGGEEGALKGPSIMPGGNKKAYKTVAPFLNTIAAKDKNNLPCCTYVGPEGSGHFVKMIHNGIEYAEMQLLCEVYGILKNQGNNLDEIAAILNSWKDTANSYLLEITIDILQKKEGDGWLLEKILDKAGNKGTGNWATIASAQLGVPSTLIASALFARYTSFHKEDRMRFQDLYQSNQNENPVISVDDLLHAYRFSRIVNHYQGFKIIGQASQTFKWDLNLSEIARIWTNGCIVRSALMEDLAGLFKQTDDILKDKNTAAQIKKMKPSVNKVVAQCILHEFPIPCLSEAVNFFNGLTTAHSTANLIQAQRDYFGAHTYQRVDDSSNQFYHTNWKKQIN